jgi:hypothetical protein
VVVAAFIVVVVGRLVGTEEVVGRLVGTDQEVGLGMVNSNCQTHCVHHTAGLDLGRCQQRQLGVLHGFLAFDAVARRTCVQARVPDTTKQ